MTLLVLLKAYTLGCQIKALMIALMHKELIAIKKINALTKKLQILLMQALQNRTTLL